MRGAMRWLLCLLLAASAAALFEDQVGKFDWRQQFIGCPTQVAFDGPHSGRWNQVLLSTAEKALAALSLNSGDIVWRRLQEQNSSVEMPFLVAGDVVVAIADDGRAVRGWDRRKGGLKWSVWMADSASSKLNIASAGHTVVARSGDSLVAMDTRDGSEQWRSRLPSSDWSALTRVVAPSAASSAVSRPSLSLLSAVNGKHLSFIPIGESSLSTDEATTKQTPWFHADKCLLSGGAVWCVSDGELVAASPFSSPPPLPVSAGSLLPLDIHGTVALKTPSQTTVYRILGESIQKVLSVSGVVDAIGGSESEGEPAVVVASGVSLTVYDLKGGSPLASATVGEAESRSSFSSLTLTRPSTAPEWHIVAVSHDCRVEFLVIDTKKGGTAAVEWSREEGLARVSAVEMLELPLSESQASIETEFETADVGFLGAFFRRITTQAQQLRRYIFELSHQLGSLSSLLSMKQATLADIIGAVRGSSNGRPREKAGPLERDVFNMRRILLLSSLDGVLFGLDNADGSIVWRRSAGSSLSPLSSQLGEATVPLLVQRSANYPGFHPILTAVFQEKSTGNGILLSLDPLSGRLLSRSQTAPLRKVDLLPQPALEHIHSLVIIEKNGKVRMEPEVPLSVAEKMLPVHVLDVDATAGVLTGSLLDLRRSVLEQRWSVNLHFEKGDRIISVKGKPNHQRVHSSGRVLIDRNVHYKYNNPNLVAVASLNEETAELALHAIDAVTGQIVHSGRLAKASAPLHLVHCEHWIAYSYWSERARRTELAILELYTGQEEPETRVFDSLSPPPQTPEVVAQSYIFSQGIQAMAVSETEKGATTRSLIMALPFGGLFEVTRRYVDATRPTELTQEMREEMMIPYMPEIPISTEDMINYNQTVYHVRGIRTAGSGLESTSLLLAYGIDLFYTRLTPSGTFDILKDDFDHVFISLVLAALFIGSYVCKRMVRKNALHQAWA